MVRKTSDAATTAGSWQWTRTAATQRNLLDAAASVFVEHGFTDASISDIVARAGSSVGSLYHHFGGKTELFLASGTTTKTNTSAWSPRPWRRRARPVRTIPPLRCSTWAPQLLRLHLEAPALGAGVH